MKNNQNNCRKSLKYNKKVKYGKSILQSSGCFCVSLIEKSIQKLNM